MTSYPQAQLQPAQPSASAPERSYVDWPAILAGAFVATAVSFIATAFGSAIGLSLTSSYQGTTPLYFYMAVGIWLVFVTVSSFAAGGYLTGRLRRRANDSTAHEVDIRDGAHGLVMWAATIVLGALLATAATGFMFKSGADLVSKSDTALAAYDVYVDKLLRGDGDVRQTVSLDDSTRRTVAGIVTRSPTGNFSGEDRAYLSSVIASRTALVPSEAVARVESISNTMKENAEKARKAGVIAAFFTAARLAIGAATAYAATRSGGNHRDENLDLTHLVPAYRRV